MTAASGDPPDRRRRSREPLPLRAEVDESAARRLPPRAQPPQGFLGKLKVFLELVKFEHSVFALPYAYIGALYGAATMVSSAIAARPAGDAAVEWLPRLVVLRSQDSVLQTLPSFQSMAWITVAMIGARSFAFVVNRAADKEIDARNPRTAGRAVPAGLVKAKELWFFSALVLAAFLLAVSQLHPITWWLWPIPLAAFIVYPYTKRFTWLCHYWLGLCLGLAPVGAWTAVTGDPLAAPAYVFGLAVMLWTAGFDIIYATQDVEYDRRDGIHSVPADLGIAAGLAQTRVLHLLTVALLALAGYLVGAGWPYYAGVAIAAMLLAYENAIVSPKDLSRVNAAFFTTNGIIAIVIMAGAVVDVVMLGG